MLLNKAYLWNNIKCNVNKFIFLRCIGNPANSEKIDKSLDEDNNEQNDKEASNKWYIPQSVQLDNVTLPTNSPKYGFADRISDALGVFEVC